jgi:hypothetical protein
MKNFLRGLGELACALSVIAVAVLIPCLAGWALVHVVGKTSGADSWALVLAQVACGFIAIFGIPACLWLQGLVLTKLKG